MSLRFRFVPPTVDARIVVHAAIPAATHAAAEVIYAASQALVPVDTGALKASGKVTQDGDRAHISYEGIAPDGYDYGVRVHEDMSLNHPNGGQAKYLEQPMHTEADRARAAILAELTRAAGL